MDGPWGHDARDVATTRTDRRDTAVRGTLPLGAFLSRPPAPALATSQDTALPGLKSQSTVPAWGQGRGLGLSGALHVCCAAPWMPPGAWPGPPAPRLLGLLPPSPRPCQELEHSLGPQPPTACPAAPRGRHPWRRQGAQGQGHPGCRAQAGLSQRVSGTEDGLSA